MPGTETNVTPDMLAPIMPKATIAHGELWRAMKKSLLSALRLVSHDSPSNSRKYTSMERMMIMDAKDGRKIRVAKNSRYI